LYEDLRQHEVCGLRPDCLFGGDSLSIVQVGFETHLAGKRSLCFEGSGSALIPATSVVLFCVTS
jgi:hypothetical protein